ncbi:MAG: ribokinase [Thermoleophilia bacterium]|nr:ribokinase [Thermoleophilia bacterium]
MVGHVEWIDFVAVDRVPGPGEIVQAKETWGEAAGGGGVAAARLAELAGSATLFTALGDDEFGRAAAAQLQDLGVRLEIDWRADQQRRGFCYLDDEGERTITLLSEKLRPRRSAPLPWNDLATFDAVYFTGGDAEAVRAARAARVLVATPRELPTLREAAVALDALVGSAIDPSERYREGDLDPPPPLVVWTEGSKGGRIEPGSRRWDAPPVPGPYRDSYGAGDSFAAYLTFALAEGRSPDDAVRFGADGAAEAIARRGAHGIHR